MSPLDRFKRAQADPYAGFETALREIRSGRKRGHWIWYIFPQLDGLGMSPMARDYAIEDEAEAAEYLRDEELRERLLSIARAVADQLLVGRPGHSLRLSTLMGSEIDAKKLVSSLTLFAEVARRLAAEDMDRRSDGVETEAYASVISTADDILAIALVQGYRPCAFTRHALAMTD